MYKMISGLRYKDNFISEAQEIDIMRIIDSVEWNLSLKRRTQHYGYLYDYRSRRIETTTPIPAGIMDILPFRADQLIVNEYLPGQGITQHIDADIFSDPIISISLLSDIVMTFTKNILNEIDDSDNSELHNIVLRRRSIVVLSKESRYVYKHGIIARKTDDIDGITTKRDRRVSLTFRNINR